MSKQKSQQQRELDVLKRLANGEALKWVCVADKQWLPDATLIRSFATLGAPTHKRVAMRTLDALLRHGLIDMDRSSPVEDIRGRLQDGEVWYFITEKGRQYVQTEGLGAAA